MSTGLVIVVVVLGLIALLALGGAAANARRRSERKDAIGAQVEEANRALAAARAEDRGWDAAILDAAARRELARLRPGVAVRELSLVQVLDRPGKDEDKAVFRVVTDTGEERLALARRGDDWLAEDPT
jgi:type II secretory pathway pseudopilin PulG